MFKQLLGYEKLELSTQVLIEEAIKRGYEVNVLDWTSNFIAITSNNRTEYIKQATKTSLDNYVAIMIMENKYITNKLLREKGLNTPKGIKISNDYNLNEIYLKFKERKIVVKPLTTNFGLGISILDEKYTINKLEQAITLALNEDSEVLIEEFIKGEEYRFLIIGDEVIGILNRIPANVVGNGKKTIKELVEDKNQSPLRGENYSKPLQKIKLGEIEKFVLSQQGFTFESIPKENKVIYLRENSNVSNGGEPIDVTDEVHESYKALAIKASKTLGVNVTGLDMIIENINDAANEKNHSIIELNFNPALHIHKYPAKGNSRNGAKKILDMLFNNQ